jgi:S-(hydroxymethyl)glutathione dehydrogenase / alcohol dehydrogenase
LCANVDVMGQALACAHEGWGEAIIIGVAGAGEEIHVRPFLLVTGRSWRGNGVRRYARPDAGPRHGRPVDERPHQARRDGDRHPALADINRAFDLMHAGEAIRSVVVYEETR